MRSIEYPSDLNIFDNSNGAALSGAANYLLKFSRASFCVPALVVAVDESCILTDDMIFAFYASPSGSLRTAAIKSFL